jgi:hypothetical protein
MALTVETGAGLAGADAYVSQDDFKSYCSARQYDLIGRQPAELDAKLRLATQYIDTQWRFKGTRLSASQALEFPRSGLVDWSGFTISGVPKRLKDAACELAFAALSTDLYEVADRGGRIKSESVGPISVTYADDAPAGKVFTFATRLLQPFVRDTSDIGAPEFGGATEGYFTLGMHDDVSAGTAEE